jgi:hypothetical protein
VQERQTTGSKENVLKYMMGVIMMQMTAKAGIKNTDRSQLMLYFKSFHSYTTSEFSLHKTARK